MRTVGGRLVQTSCQLHTSDRLHCASLAASGAKPTVRIPFDPVHNMEDYQSPHGDEHSRPHSLIFEETWQRSLVANRSLNLHLYHQLTISDEGNLEKAHHQLSSINTGSRLRIHALTAWWYSGKLAKACGTTRVVSDPVLCYHVVAEFCSIPSARLGHTIIAWANVSSKCIGQNKRAVQRIRRDVGADRGEGPRPSVHT